MEWAKSDICECTAAVVACKNDALRRLPSTTPDMREMMRSMSIVSDGAENFVSADDYLQPHSVELAAAGADRRPLHNVRASSCSLSVRGGDALDPLLD